MNDDNRNPFSIEAQIESEWKGKKAKVRPSARLAQRYAKTMDKLQKAEAKMTRAFRAWDKLRQQARRYERQLDKLFTE